jgi:hypothetical protein
MRDQLKDLMLLTDAVFQSRLAKMQAIAKQEKSIRDSLSVVQQRKSSGSEDPENMFVMQTLGADVLWQGWRDRQQSNLNIQLANVLAQKETLRHGLGLAFGKATAAQALYENNLELQKRAKRKRDV